MTVQRKWRLKMTCPFCFQQMTAFKTERMSRSTTEVAYKCRNIECQASMAAVMGFSRTLQPPLGWTHEEAENFSKIPPSERTVALEKKKTERSKEEQFRAAQLDIFKPKEAHK